MAEPLPIPPPEDSRALKERAEQAILGSQQALETAKKLIDESRKLCEQAEQITGKGKPG